jgi:hypothetical protein
MSISKASKISRCFFDISLIIVCPFITEYFIFLSSASNSLGVFLKQIAFAHFPD